MEKIKEFPAGEPIVGMAVCKDIVFVATTKSVYQITDGKAFQIEFVKFEDAPVKRIEDEEIPF